MSDRHLRPAHRPLKTSERTAKEVFFAMLAASSVGLLLGLGAVSQIVG